MENRATDLTGLRPVSLFARKQVMRFRGLKQGRSQKINELLSLLRSRDTFGACQEMLLKSRQLILRLYHP